MLRTLNHRLWQSLLVLLTMSFATFILIGLMPGDPVDLMIAADPRMTSADAAQLRALYGLDRPLLERYATWLRRVLSGDLGYSRLYARPVWDALAPALSNSVQLIAPSLLLALAIALPAGVIAAVRQNSWIDRVTGVVAYLGISVPPFWLALLLIMVFAVFLGVLPAGGAGHGTNGALLERMRHLVLPVACLTLASVGGYVRYVRAAMLETLRHDWIRTARAKGLSEPRVVIVHALRPALLPIVTVVGVDLGSLFSGALVVEAVFAWPGMGKLTYDAVLGNDYNLALIALLLATLMTLAGNLLADLTYGLLDPRVGLGRG